MKSKAEQSKYSKFISDNGTWVVLIVLIIAITIVNRNFFTPNNAVALLTGESVKGVLAFGVMMGRIDKNWKTSPDIKWNFTKFLVDRQGNVVSRFEPLADMKEVDAAVSALL